MERSVQSTYGLTLQQAAAEALQTTKKEKALLEGIGSSYQYTFDFHGIRFPIYEETTVDSMVVQVSEVVQARAELYENTPVPEKTHIREQGGRIGEHLDDFYVEAIQCGQLWGNYAFEREHSQFVALRHVFEFNGIKVPFNPWKEGEPERVRKVVLDELEKGNAYCPGLICTQEPFPSGSHKTTD